MHIDPTLVFPTYHVLARICITLSVDHMGQFVWGKPTATGQSLSSSHSDGGEKHGEQMGNAGLVSRRVLIHSGQRRAGLFRLTCLQKASE